MSVASFNDAPRIRAYLDINTGGPRVFLVVCSVQPTQYLRGVKSCTLGQCSWNDFEGFTIFSDGILSQSRSPVSECLYSLDQLHFGSTSTWHQSGVPGDR